jgi:hypothetical protein
MQKLEAWRSQQVQLSVQQQRQHDRQIAGIAGAAQIASAAPQALADSGLRVLQTMTE